MIEAMTEYMNTLFDIFMSKTVVELHLFRKFLFGSPAKFRISLIR